MASTIFPIISSPIKSIQRGVSTSAGNTTISSVDLSKSFVMSYSDGSAGVIGIEGTESGTLSPTGGSIIGSGGGNAASGGGSMPTYAGTRSVTGGVGPTVYVKEYGAYLANSTTLTTTGACRWEVVEYN